MLQSASLRSVTLAAVLALALPSWAAAAPRHPAQPPAAPTFRAGSPFSWLWGQLLAFLAPNSCTTDPSGLPGAQEALTLDEGCTIDPSGRCQPVASALTATGSGCTIDPNGCR